MARVLSSWIDGYLEYTSALHAPVIYRHWAGIFAVAAACQKRMWLRVEGQRQFPNLYVLLVGPPAIGKSVAMKYMRDEFLVHTKGALHLTPSDLTKRAFYEKFEASSASYKINGKIEEHQAMVAVLDEWSVFVEKHDEQFMCFLSDIYDNPVVRDYSTKHVGENKLEHANLNMLGGTTPKQLKDRFSEQSLEGGFPSRCILVYSADRIQVDTGLRVVGTEAKSSEFVGDKRLAENLRHDLHEMLQVNGEFAWTAGAAKLAEDWVAAGMPPRPSDPKLEHYSGRRLAHLTKLCMAHSVSRTDNMVISEDDYERSKQVLLVTEVAMVEAVAQLGMNAQMPVMLLARKAVEHYYKRHSAPCPDYYIRRTIASEVPLHLMSMVIEQIVKMNWIIDVSSDEHRKVYEPRSEGL